ncbi:Gfo/Idh/MocA family protein [Haloarcula nitratireducens]|uniref:Gfo/Idh/MocA family oxidoreductase n=1 Tax=Haloarcula nitratireducens TaxID=2487749 RepID=A0AAW4PH03_9EURY|nr:Gfo/Idh/MocA family oxidoreductase [Halomicroarcula nitratireducens]MBX0297300.1 Gfo/Idh/MocA family oxidoreductase [Halomicroarcula nitratireducens]
MTYSAGIIGTGGIAGMGILGMHDEDEIGQKKVRASHAGGYDAAEGIELVAVADVDEEKLDRFGEAWDIPESGRYVGHAAMLEAEDLDVVSVCTPSYLHADHVVDAARSAADPALVWCEKPIASSVSDAETMVETCAETETELLVNHSFRFTSKLRRLRELVREDEIIGEVQSVATQFRMELLRNSTHLLDTLVYLLDDRASEVSGYITGENEAVDSLQAAERVDDAGGGGFVVMDDGAFVTIDCTIPRAESSMTLNFIGTEGKLYLNNDDGEWRYWRLEDGDHVEEPLPGIEGAWTWDEDYRDAFANAASDVVSVLDGEMANPSTGEEATRSLEIIAGFYISHYTGGRVSVPLDRPLRDVTITSW